MRSTAAQLIHKKVILKQHRNSVATYKLSDVFQEWQLRGQYHITLSLFLDYQLHSVQCFHSNYRDLLKNLSKTERQKSLGLELSKL